MKTQESFSAKEEEGCHKRKSIRNSGNFLNSLYCLKLLEQALIIGVLCVKVGLDLDHLLHPCPVSLSL